ncbi:hypothetical protein [Turicimonas muris]|uniref:hypothetical protein n=1 Tax=Turicimonas muris TaxID=1796652 RepID=UPI00272AF2C9|nr:hypothetical protein [Turicimonas muris]
MDFSEVGEEEGKYCITNSGKMFNRKMVRESKILNREEKSPRVNHSLAVFGNLDSKTQSCSLAGKDHPEICFSSNNGLSGQISDF